MPAPFFSVAAPFFPVARPCPGRAAHNFLSRFPADGRGRPPYLLVFVRRYSLGLITTWMPLPSRSLANFLASASEPTIAP